MYYGERLNSISHLVGAALALMGLGALVTVSVQSGDPWVIVSFAVFGFMLVLLFTMSTLYHSFRAPNIKGIFKTLDHSAIFLLIAGTYTPFTLVSMRDSSGWFLFGLVWALAALGILGEVFLKGTRAKVAQLTLYLAMGWACAIDMSGLRASLPPIGFSLVFAGGLAYTAGVPFYVVDKLGRFRHAHGIWHFFVLVGAACHFAAVIGFVR
ncbi:MAG: hemolysin III family protein [Pseudomonadota bacterium]